MCYGEGIHPIPTDDAVCAARLIVAFARHELAFSVQLEATEDVLRIGSPTKVRHATCVTDMDVK